MHRPILHNQKGFLRTTLNIFKDKRLYLYLFLDLLLIVSIYISATTFGEYIQTKSTTLKSLDIQGLMQQDQAQALSALTELKSFLIIFIAVIVTITLSSFILFSLLQAIIWADIKKEKLNGIWRWIPFHIVLLIPVILFLIIAFIIAFLFNLATSVLSPNFATFLHNLATLYLFTFFLILINTVYKKFQEKKLMWLSIGEALSTIQQHKSKIALISLVATAAFLLIGFLLYPLAYLNLTQTTINFLSIPLYLLLMGVIRLIVANHFGAADSA